MRINRRITAAALAFGLGAASVFGSTTPAAATATEVEFRKIDTSNFPTVRMQVLRPSDAPLSEPIKLSENGVPVTNAQIQTLAEANERVGVFLLLDTTEAAKSQGVLEAQKVAAKDFVARMQTNEQYGIIAINGTARPVVNLTSDKAALTGAIDNLRAGGTASLNDGIRLASRLLQTENGLQANVVVISAAPEGSSSTSSNEALGALNAAKASLFSIGLTTVNQNVNQQALRTMAERTGGEFQVLAENGQLSTALTKYQNNLQSQAFIRFDSTQKRSVTLSIGVGQFKGAAEATPGTVSLGSDISPPAPAAQDPGFFSGKTAVVLVALVVFFFVALLGYGLLEIFGNERNQLSSALRPYLDGPQKDDDGPRDFSKLADSEIIKKAIASTAKAAQDRGLLQWVQVRLEQADLPLRPAEALFFTGVTAVIGMLLGVVLGGFLGLFVSGLIFLWLPFLVTGFMAKRRRKKFTSQLPDMLQLLAGSMRAGYSLVQGLDAVSKQAEAPMGTELQRAMSEARLGRPVDEALQDVADRTGSDDFEWAVMAIKIQREVGGNLAELLLTVSETMIARERLRREVKGLTAEGRMSAVILVGLPPSVGAGVMVVNPTYMQPMLDNVLGQMALAGAAVLMGIGWFVMQKMIEIEA